MPSRCDDTLVTCCHIYCERAISFLVERATVYHKTRFYAERIYTILMKNNINHILRILTCEYVVYCVNNKTLHIAYAMCMLSKFIELYYYDEYKSAFK